MKLKTSKDLENDNLLFGKDNEKDKLIRTGFMLALRSSKQESIKWIRELEQGNITISNGLPETDEKSEIYPLDEPKKRLLRLWIKHFFNIKDEELK